MERKTIGGFIATLRKANGMTQKELAEQLNVSDKTVSRWERDDGVPDLSVIPVLAEIFQVSCDELLRGERKPITERVEEKEEVTTAKGEKQKQRILTVSLSKFKTRSFIAMGIAGAGLIGAMIGNYGFLRAYIGFFVGAVFYLASVICEAVFVNGAFLSVADDDLSGEEVGKYKGAVIRLAEGAFGLIAVLLGASLPLIIFPHDTYAGLSGETWLLYGALLGVVTLIIYSIICNVLNARLLEKGVYHLGEKAEQKYWSNHALKKKCAFILIAVLIGTYMVHSFVLTRWDAVSLAEGTEFHDYESFIAYMEQDIPYYHSYTENGQYTVEVEKVIPDSTTYYDEFGNEISEEEALREVIRISDGTEEGKVVCEYIARNEMVSSISYTQKDGSILPITVLTYDEVRAGQTKLNMINALFMAVYCMEAVGFMLFYFKKREK